MLHQNGDGEVIRMEKGSGIRALFYAFRNRNRRTSACLSEPHPRTSPQPSPKQREQYRGEGWTSSSYMKWISNDQIGMHLEIDQSAFTLTKRLQTK